MDGAPRVWASLEETCEKPDTSWRWRTSERLGYQMTRMRFLTGTGIVLLLIGGAMQAYHPKLESPPVTAEIQAPDEVRQILRQRCYSCHSNETKLPWYDNLAPAYWVVRGDVLEGRE